MRDVEIHRVRLCVVYMRASENPRQLPSDGTLTAMSSIISQVPSDARQVLGPKKFPLLSSILPSTISLISYRFYLSGLQFLV